MHFLYGFLEQLAGLMECANDPWTKQTGTFLKRT
jgi:hypothetical protein